MYNNDKYNKIFYVNSTAEEPMESPLVVDSEPEKTRSRA